MQPNFIDARRTPVLLAAFAALLVAASTPAILHAQPAPTASVSPHAASTSLPDMAAIAARFSPIVVNISVTGTRRVSTTTDATPDPAEDPDSAMAPDETDAMRDFLRNFQQRFGGLPPQLKLPVRGEGSGFIVRSDGLIMTNAHVVANADEVLVRLSDRREFRAKVLGSDKLTPGKVQATAAAAEADKDDEPAAWSVQSPHAPDKHG